MAPHKPREPSIERTSEYEEFLGKLEEFHQKRGTILEREPKIGNRHIDLLRLYKRVVEEGGYDKVSDTKGNKLAWRRIAGEFLPGSPNLTTQAFLVKTAYYKNLAAYEITTVHKREPPPKEILEDVSAKGGDLLNRTLENYHRPNSREAERLKNGEEDSEESDEDGEPKRTPKEDRMDIDDAPGSTGRVTRALRHAPPQRVLFQPEMSTRQTRQSTGHTPQSYSNGSYGTSVAAMTIANYEPRTAAPSSMKPVATPANNPEHFRQLRMKYVLNRKNRVVRPVKGMMLPGTGFPGPSIYIRALNALQSKIPEEEAYALHHFVKISHERGDKFRFEQFSGLAEALITKVVEAGSIFYDVKWKIAYTEENMDRPDVLNGLFGTKDLMERIQKLEVREIEDDLLPGDDARNLRLVNEAALIIRNMAMLHENAQLLSLIPSVRDMLVIILNLPRHGTAVELKHYALEIAEQLTRFWILEPQNPVYRSLLAQVDSEDRGSIITSIKALGRISMELEAPNKLTGVPVKTLRAVCEWLLVEDEELRNACLDFLYLFTGFSDNVEILANEVDIEALVIQLVRLLQYGAIPYEEKKSNNKSSRSSQPVDSPPKLSAAIIEQLAALDEPERSSQWLRTCFEEEPSGEITQIQLWSSYNSAFTEIMAAKTENKPLMAAKDFITNVSTTFSGASAQVVNFNNVPKYTIRGIRPRAVPADPTTKKPYMRCCWHPPSLLNGLSDLRHSGRVECGEFATNARAMWEHILLTHLKISRDEIGKWMLEQKPDVNMENGESVSVSKPPQYNCHWGGCTHFGREGTSSAYEAGQHIKTHLPDTSIMQSIHARHNRTPSNATLLSTPSQTLTENFQQPQFAQPVGLGSLGMGPRYTGYNDPYNQYTAQHRHSRDQPPTAPQPLPNFRFYNTATDDTPAQDAAGLPLASVLVLRNLARQLAKLPPPSSIHDIPDSPTLSKRSRDASPESRRTTGAKKPRLSDAANKAQRENEEMEKEERAAEGAGWVERVFAPVKEQLFFVASHNLTLKSYMSGLLKAIAAGGG
ncbi:hypothetical protein M011DRAFT_465459 [Sporormia fimetaria CBS 119925]|uniref:RSC complex subunit Rsc9 n=1 Tax=Sporormia fimetaria CBS 119925 TaxID=1340428 RepID=A0A6A6VJQ9_9PLEO|nr:hypothetical protein M011DRAFT_465459 [Sporormia fimetaria CBS 119925]